MAANQLSAILVNGLTDESFRRDLLDSPHQVLTNFGLSPEELDAISTISRRANTFEEFAAAMAHWLSLDRPALHQSVPSVSWAAL
jgi:hypothetical protein